MSDMEMSTPPPDVDLLAEETTEEVLVIDDGPSEVFPTAPGDFNVALVMHGALVNREVGALLLKMLSDKLEIITLADTFENRKHTFQVVDILVRV